MGVAVFGGAIGTMAITKAFFYVDYVNLSIVIFLQKLQPVFALILAGIFLKEKLSREFFFWATLAIIGAYILTLGFNVPQFNAAEKTIEAAFFALVASISFAFSTVLSKRALKNVSFHLGSYLRFLTSSIILFLLVMSLGDFSSVNEITNIQIIVFLLIAFSSGGPAIFLYYYGLKYITASRATIFELAFPLTAVILEYFVHDEILKWDQWIGVMILLYSIFQVNRTSDK
jgi:drug/metabolite transporter (DMT)-like permease